MEWVRESCNEFALSDFEDVMGPETFETQFFSRTEVVRWLNAVELPSIYQFEKCDKETLLDGGEESNGVEVANQSGPNFDAREEFEQWLVLDTWNYEGAMFLIAGVIPSEIYEGMGYFTTDLRLLHNDEGEKDDRIFRISTLNRLWKSNPDNPDRAEPKVFLEWAKKKNIEIPWLQDVQSRGFLVPEPEAPTVEEKPMGKRERRSLLNIIGALVELARSPREGREKDAGLIRELVQNYGQAQGVSKRNLEVVLPEAKNNLMNDLEG
ncbi:hypothetical protein LPB72_18630 [Hydrogenophaga crassostreae]|uniref:Uncharacterized protein n=2 Tax=Hydrogenophaga crassostreae TaxID=1763535 RepID=A0A167H2A0_9BURK|nr:hypothetical protein LPB072_09135 [Hydrogenophaga crassostreae]OAD40169.1 hypothetical protein LPB72_18630 [Hydrogenophaga crassostreae]